jgi:phenylacetate-coenzyme A ligase PaaK-like adenylate-forming protein
MRETKRAKVREKRLVEIVRCARQHSPYYRGLGDKITPLRITADKQERVDVPFRRLADRSEYKISDIRSFMKNHDNIGRKFKGNYLVFTASGSTGDPLVVLCDDNTNNIMSVLVEIRLSEEEPRQYPHNGKFKHVTNARYNQCDPGSLENAK